MEDAEPALRGWIAAEPDMTLGGVRERLPRQGFGVENSSTLASVGQLKLTFKKNATPASKSERTCRRRVWRGVKRSGVDVEKLVFIYENWGTTNMTRSYGRAPKGCRCVGSAPLGDWKRLPFRRGCATIN